MDRHGYFKKVLKIVDNIEDYEWSSKYSKEILPLNSTSILNYYDTIINSNKDVKLFIAFIQYEYYSWLDENDTTLLSDFSIVFFVKDRKTGDIKPIVSILSKEYNSYLLEDDEDFEKYSLPDIIRKIIEKEIDIGGLFDDI
ncbi:MULTISPECIES: hypothetical protein [Staphylococcus]|uniref:hypothetical protein n=1 Tax=Staphylococcus TaxID=1279 RepID=UPI001951A8AA|nr:MULTISPECIES: hypothetical protein [Staphylococcus]MCD8863883.1 hypothetical protein [Staphylococcus arlettae]